MLVMLQVVSAAAAIFAAAFWFWSATIAIPRVTMAVIQADGSVKRPPHEAAFKNQSKLSAIAAAAAGVSSLAQAGAALVPLILLVPPAPL